MNSLQQKTGIVIINLTCSELSLLLLAYRLWNAMYAMSTDKIRPEEMLPCGPEDQLMCRAVKIKRGQKNDWPPAD